MVHEYDVIRARVILNSVRGGNDAGFMLVMLGQVLGRTNTGYVADGVYIHDDVVFVKSVTLVSDRNLPDGTVDYRIILESHDWEYMLDVLSNIMKEFTCVDIENIWTCDRYTELNPEKREITLKKEE